MFKGLKFLAIALLSVLVACSTAAITPIKNNSATVPSSLFSMETHNPLHFPTIPVASLRLWGTNTYWSQMNPAPGTYSFTMLDRWTAVAQTNNVDLIYTFGEVPTWASSNPALICGNNANIPLGSCAPPSDLNADGTGTDEIWQNFVTAIATHAAGKIKYWEMWNEPTVPGYWQGTNAQLLRMAQDAYAIIKAIDPTAMVTTPSPSTGIHGVANWMGPYLALGGGQYADIISFHGYNYSDTLGVYPQPEDIIALIENLKVQTALYGQADKPLWDTEGSWGDTTGNGFTDPDLHAGYLTRHYILQESQGVARYYWFAWDNSPGDGLWMPSGLSEAGMAYQQVEKWLVGMTPMGCSQSGTVWTCDYAGLNDYLAQVVWDTAQTCSEGVCTTSAYDVPSQYNTCQDLLSNSCPIVDRTVLIGYKPILLTSF